MTFLSFSRVVIAAALLTTLLIAEETSSSKKKKKAKSPPSAAPVVKSIKAKDLADDPIPADIKLVEFFSIDKNPGKGTLNYTSAGNTEAIVLGTDTGHYGLAMVFPGANLPEPYNKDFKKNDIVQIALGTLKSNLQLQVPQFGAATLISSGPLRQKTTFKLMVPTGTETNLKNMALLLFTSPQTPNEQSDEEKLKGTYFAQSGTVVVTPKGKSEAVVIKSGGRKYNFKSQAMQFEFRAKLATPFNAQEQELKGTVEFAVYWPSGRGAKSLAKRIAGDSLTGMGPVPMPEGLSTHSRDIAGSTKKDTAKSPPTNPE